MGDKSEDSNLPSKSMEQMVESQLVAKSNNLITAKYRSSLLENQIMSISLTRLFVDPVTKCPKAEFSPAEIKEILGRTSDRNIYKRLKKVAKSITGHQMIIEDGKNNFKIFTMVTNADYQDKKLTIRFNSEMTPYVLNLRGNFTTYELSNIIGFKCDYSYRIYELLKKEAYKINPDIPNDIVTKEYGVNELKCMIGIVNMDEVAVRDAVERKVSWDDIVEKVAVEKQFQDWYEFRRGVIERAKKELRLNSDIKFDYELKKYGYGGKVRSIVFYISLNNLDNVTAEKIKVREKTLKQITPVYDETEPEFVRLLPPELVCYVGKNKLTQDNLFAFLDVAKNDVDKVISAIKMADEQPHVKKYVGWIISCIKKDFDKPIEVVNGSSEQADRISEIKRNVSENEQEIALRVWSKSKSREDYREFIEFSQKNGISEDALEIMYSPAELVECFVKWKKGENPF